MSKLTERNFGGALAPVVHRRWRIPPSLGWIALVTKGTFGFALIVTAPWAPLKNGMCVHHRLICRGSWRD